MMGRQLVMDCVSNRFCKIEHVSQIRESALCVVVSRETHCKLR